MDPKQGQSRQHEWEPQLELTITPGSNGVSFMAWNGANRIAVCGRERDVHVHDFDVTLNRRISFVNDISEVRFAKRDLLVISALSGEVSILKLKKDFSRNVNPVQFQRHLLAHNAPVFALDVDSCGDTFISGGADKVVKLWTVSGQKLLGQFRKHNNAVRHLTYTSDGLCFASAGDDREIIEWDIRSQNPISAIANHCGGGASSLGFLPEGHLVVGHRDNNLRVFDARTKKVLATYRVYDNPIRSLSLHTSGQFVATSCPEDQCVSIIDLLNGVPLTTFTIKMPVKQALFLSPCDPPVNDFDTSDLLCVPGRGRKLNIFNCDLTRLLEDEERMSQSHQMSSYPECANAGVPVADEKEKTADERDVVDTNNKHPVSKASGDLAERVPLESNNRVESGAEMMARRTRRMTLARRTIKPRRISLDDLHEEQERQESTTRSKELQEEVVNEAAAIRQAESALLNKLIGQIADMSDRMDRLEIMITNRFNELAHGIASLEGRCLKANANESSIE
ncbi:POC1 centriolar protein homolog [Varroa destructor]|uniref:Uncharacterized protein n=1 Tax=Varroa destructor TaxID=109461 RepID=A0A7M7M5C6_VARDE|nr:POC1 centriolar protein homolog [Varroa destructor]